MHNESIIRTLTLVAAAMLATTPAIAQRIAAPAVDRYGYTFIDSTSLQCPAQAIDMSAASPLTLVAASGDYTALDEGAAVVALAVPFELFDNPLSALVASSNGYLAATDNLASENGADYRSACPLPAIGVNGPATQARIFVYHDDLNGDTGNGNMRSRYFATCPRASDSGINEACTVIDWSNWGKVGTSGLSMQAVLYHQSWEIALQYTTLDASSGASATVGVQDPAQDWGVAARCGGTASIPAPGAICLFDPRFPPGSLGVEDLLFADGFEGLPQRAKRHR